MESQCPKSTQGTDHRLEFRDDSGGMTTWLCLDCGEFIQQYTDHQGC